MGATVIVGLVLAAGAAAASPVVRAPHPLIGAGSRPAAATRFGHLGGIVLSRRPNALSGPHAAAGAARGSGVGGAGPPRVGLGSGNLSYHGGPVMHQSMAYAIYWVPSGYSVSTNYESLINGFFRNVAAANGRSDNVYSVAAQYGDSTGPGTYASSFGGAVVDTDPFPANGCTDNSLPVCLTDAQLQAEIDKVIAAHGWQAGLSREFFIFTPPPVGSCVDSTSSTCAYSFYCAYHGSFTSGHGVGTVVYANEPYAAQPAAPGACDLGERPNGDDADPTINLISHEETESITDPLLNAWSDDEGFEIGDKCAWIFGQPLGSTGGSGTNTDYNEQIGTGRYYLQEEWSNRTVDPSSQEPGSCVQRDIPQLVLTGPGKGNVSGSGGLACVSDPCDLSSKVGATLTLAPHPASGSSFVGWQGDCSGTATCTVTVTPTTSVAARFETSQLPSGWAAEPLAPPAGVDPLPPGTDPAWSFYRVAESAAGKERAITVFSTPGGCGVGAPEESGGIFLQRQTDTGWTADGTLAAPSVGTDGWRYWPSCSEFGAEITLSADGSTLLASQNMATLSNYRCAAFVYERGGTGWKLAATLFPPGFGPAGSPTSDGCDYFGINSTLSGDGKTAVVLSSGRVDVYVRGFSGWSLQRHLVLPSADNCNTTIGPPRLAISGNGSRLLVGAPDCIVSGAAYAGRVYDYERSGSAWSLAQTIDTPEPIYNNYFGEGLALSNDGNTAAIGTQDSTGLPLFAGAVWVYEHDGSGWHPRVRLTTPAPELYGLMDCPYVSDDGSQIVCSAFDTVGFDPSQGSLYSFQRPGASWSSAPTPLRFFAGDGHAEDNLGTAHYAITWFTPPAVAVPAAGGDIASTISAENVGIYGKDRIGYEFTTGPVIRSFTPAHARAGTQITITGANFSNATAVRFFGVAATRFTVDSPTKITATVPPTATTGTIGVTTPKGSGWSRSSFSPQPGIGSLSPGRGVAGTRVTIDGTNLAEASAVRFNGVAAASFNVESPTEITAVVPATATAGPLTVVTPGGSGSSFAAFKPLPAVRSISPGRGVAGTRVTISGSNLAGASAVRFHRAAATRFTVTSPTQITAVVPATATRGVLTVVTPTGRASSATSFRPLPAVRSLSPGRGVAGTRVTISGSNLAGASAVRFHRAAATRFRVTSPTQVTAVVPATATRGVLTVVTPTGRASSATSFRPLPVVQSISPRQGLAGTHVLIRGTNLAGTSSVEFAGRKAQFLRRSPTALVVRVPKEAGVGHVTVRTSDGRAVSTAMFKPLPSIGSVRPESAHAGARVTIAGANLIGVFGVEFHGHPAHFRVTSPLRIVATVPRNATTGRITVRTRAGRAASRRAFRPLPATLRSRA